MICGGILLKPRGSFQNQLFGHKTVYLFGAFGGTVYRKLCIADDKVDGGAVAFAADILKQLKMGGIGTAVLKHDIQVQVDGTAQQFVADNPRGHFMVFKRNDIAVQCQIPLICRQRNHNLVKTKKQEILRQMRGTKRAFAGTGDSG